MTRIVVGVDGSEHSARALRRAVEEAKLRDGTVDAVFVYDPPRRGLADDLIGLPYGVAPAMGNISAADPAHDAPSPEATAAAKAEARLKRFVDEATTGIDGPEPRVVAIAADHAAMALIEQSANADLLVIGTRGLGGFAGMLLGSVAHQCIQRSRCPLLILPPETD